MNHELIEEEQRIGRLRRFYVLPKYRRRGIGKKLVELILLEAKMHFDVIHLKTETEDAGRFYQALGFTRTYRISNVTHYLDLKKERKD